MARKPTTPPGPVGAAPPRIIHTRGSGDRRIVFVDDAVWLPLDLDDRWRVAYRLTVQAGAVVVAEIRVLPREDHQVAPAEWCGLPALVPAGGITARLLRRVRVGAHHRVADEVLRLARDSFPLVPYSAARHNLQTLSSAERRRGRPRRPALFYAGVAQRYDAACKRGSGHPSLDVAHEMRADAGLVRQWLYRARELKFLPRAEAAGRTGQQGARGGALTPLALALLAGPKGKEVKPPAGRQATRKRKTPGRARAAGAALTKRGTAAVKRGMNKTKGGRA